MSYVTRLSPISPLSRAITSMLFNHEICHSFNSFPLELYRVHTPVPSLSTHFLFTLFVNAIQLPLHNICRHLANSMTSGNKIINLLQQNFWNLNYSYITVAVSNLYINVKKFTSNPCLWYLNIGSVPLYCISTPFPKHLLIF